MNILHIVAGDLNGGAARGAYWLHLALLKKNVNSKILTNSNNNLNSNKIYALSKNFFSRVKFSLLTRSVEFLKLPYYQRHKKIFSTGFDGIDITNHYLYNDADIINFHWINGLVNIRSIKNISKPIVWTIRDMWPMTGGCHYALNSCKKFEKNCGRCPLLNSKQKQDLSYKIHQNKIKNYSVKNLNIVGISEWISNHAKNSVVFKKRPIYTIGNCINNKIFFPQSKSKAKKLLKLPLDKKIILVGSQNLKDFYKGFDLFLDSIKKIRTKNFHILVFGKLNNFKIKNYSHTELGFINSNSKMRIIYSAADVYVSPSTLEAFGKTVAEAMACGTPTVIFDKIGSVDIVSHKIDGYIASNSDTSDLANGIDWILNYKKYKILSKKSKKKIQDKFSFDKIGNDYKNLYKKILNDQ
jgi:glycosyltransferase involved in cell wall biosynthesis